MTRSDVLTGFSGKKLWRGAVLLVSVAQWRNCWQRRASLPEL